jgi:hypothetical protein
MKNKANCSLWGKDSTCACTPCLVLPHLAWFCPDVMFIRWFKIMLLCDQETPCAAVHWNAGYWKLVGQTLHGLDSVVEKFTAGIPEDFFYYRMKYCPLHNGKEMNYKWLKQQLVTCYAFSIIRWRFLNAYFHARSLWHGYLYTVDLLWT